MEPTSITEKLLYNTVRIETATANGKGTGTGFIFSYEYDSQYYPFIVTNKHVVKGAHTGWLYFTQSRDGKPITGLPFRLEVAGGFEAAWYGHPKDEIDVAIIPLVPLVQQIKSMGADIFVMPIGDDLIPTDNIISELDALETITFIGYPNGLWDTKNFLPIIRRGITATPASMDFQGEKQFLIDASVFPGSSGSPVFILNIGMYTNKFGTTNVASRIIFLGIVASVFYREDLNKIQIMSQPTVDVPVAVSRQMIDIGIVFKASTIVETIESYLIKFNAKKAENT